MHNQQLVWEEVTHRDWRVEELRLSLEEASGCLMEARVGAQTGRKKTTLRTASTARLVAAANPPKSPSPSLWKTSMNQKKNQKNDCLPPERHKLQYPHIQMLDLPIDHFFPNQSFTAANCSALTCCNSFGSFLFGVRRSTQWAQSTQSITLAVMSLLLVSTPAHFQGSI